MAKKASSNGAPRGPSAESAQELGPEDAGALRIGATDLGMVRLIVTTPNEVVELDFSAEDAREIAEELMAAAALCDRGGRS